MSEYQSQPERQTESPALGRADQEYEDIMASEPDIVMAAAEEKAEMARDRWKLEGNPDAREQLAAEIATAVRILDEVKKWAAAETRVKAREGEFTSFPDSMRVLEEMGADDESVLDAIRWTKEGYYREVKAEIELRAELAEQDRQAAAAERHEADDQRREQDTGEAREAVERANEKLVIAEVMKYAGKATQLQTDIRLGGENGYKSIGDGPKDLQHIGLGISVTPQENLGKDWHHHLNEAVSFTKLIDRKTKEEEYQAFVKKTMLGKNVTETRKRTVDVPESEFPVKRVFSAGGAEEEVVRFRYQFKYSDQTMAYGVNTGELPHYQEFVGGRDGQVVSLGLDLPESVASELQASIESNPAMAREIAEKLMLEHSGGVITPQLWTEGGDVNHPIRPPWPKLPKNWQVGIVTGEEMIRGGGNNQGGIQEGYAVDRRIMDGSLVDS
jgi:hypothetical protein